MSRSCSICGRVERGRSREHKVLYRRVVRGRIVLVCQACHFRNPALCRPRRLGKDIQTALAEIHGHRCLRCGRDLAGILWSPIISRLNGRVGDLRLCNQVLACSICAGGGDWGPKTASKVAANIKKLGRVALGTDLSSKRNKHKLLKIVELKFRVRN